MDYKDMFVNILDYYTKWYNNMYQIKDIKIEPSEASKQHVEHLKDTL